MLSQAKALVVFSGGQDSTICLGYALKTWDHVECISFDYGQRHKIEIEAAKNVIAVYQRIYKKEIHHRIVNVQDILRSTSPLTSNNDLEQYENNEQMEAVIGDRVEKTFVPMRNTFFLTIAANYAISIDAGVIVTGVCEADNANYPDCTGEFLRKLQDAISESLGLTGIGIDHQIRLTAPLLNKSKEASIRMAAEIPGAIQALSQSHTAYDGQYPPIGKDHATVLRAHGFSQANVPDPLIVRAWLEGRMELPEDLVYKKLREVMIPITNVR